MYIRPNFPTKAAAKRAIANGETVTVFEPGFGVAPENGTGAVEGPWSPRPHTWYGQVVIENGRVTKIK